MPSELVSVVIPCHNCAQYVSEAIESVLGQSYQHREIIVVDDGSTDRTPEVLAGYADRVRVVRQARAGEAEARNAGLRVARGKHIGFLDADDLWLPEKLERQVALLETRPDCAWVYTDCCRFDEGGRAPRSHFQSAAARPPEGHILADFVKWHPPLVITVLARAECVAQVGWFDRTLPVAPDTDFLLRLAAGFPAGCVDEVLALYRQHAAQITRAEAPGRTPLYWRCTWQVYSRFLRRPPAYVPREARESVAPVLRRIAADMACRLAEDHLQHGRRCAALPWVARAADRLRTEPSYWLGLLADAVLPAALANVARRGWRRARGSQAQ